MFVFVVPGVQSDRVGPLNPWVEMNLGPETPMICGLELHRSVIQTALMVNGSFRYETPHQVVLVRHTWRVHK